MENLGSSLAYLKRLPVTKLKLDQSFIRDIPADANCIAIARAILKLGEAIGITVVAEGVETEAQYDFLLNTNCTFAQGYWYAKPMMPKKLKNFINKNCNKNT